MSNPEQEALRALYAQAQPFMEELSHNLPTLRGDIAALSLLARFAPRESRADAAAMHYNLKQSLDALVEIAARYHSAVAQLIEAERLDARIVEAELKEQTAGTGDILRFQLRQKFAEEPTDG